MFYILNLISILSAFTFGVGFLYFILDATIGKLEILNSDKDWYGLQIKDFVFLLISVIIILSFFDFYKPY